MGTLQMHSEPEVARPVDAVARRRRVRRTTRWLVLLVACIYAAFIGYAMLHGHR
jgi:type VI protein secretion system component VasF